jgi:hypothetical protein
MIHGQQNKKKTKKQKNKKNPNLAYNATSREL